MRDSVGVAVAVPVWREALLPDERLALRHLHTFLPSREIYLIAPHGLAAPVDEWPVLRFDPRWFRSAGAFGAFQLRPELYRAFAGHEYLLMHQLDALVFADRLDEFCGRTYDYIGAPWFDLPWLDGRAVGNGGLSLRRVESFLRVLDQAKRPAGGELQRAAGRARLRVLRVERRPPDGIRYTPGASSDLFWSFDAPRIDPAYTVAGFEEALRFSFETSPRRCLVLAGDELPFGCHAWSRFDPEFWEPYLLR